MFQKSVLKNFTQDESLVAIRWAEYQKYLTKIDYVKKVKEEKYQDGFLKDIFENCLGYTLDSTDPANFNLEREKKNETDGKKADGVIYVDGVIVGIIELKAQDTKNLDKIEIQAFNYHNSHSNSKYVIISNFDELRFYIDKKTVYEKFNLFTLSYDDFKRLHLLLSYESIKNDTPLKIKEKSSSFEQNISKELYKDFSSFRKHLFENLVKNNSEMNKTLLLRLTQKLCDRIIFILFAEDRDLLTPNTIKQIRERHKTDIVGFGMYEYYKIYFKGINESNAKLGIPKYNGGLFATDEALDNLIIDDSILDIEAQKLSDYDFESDISVNILGHIFEQSLTDLEELQASIDDTDFDNKKSKRKKDGVFYTPEYITKYIVDNTLGKLCEEKKTELNLLDIPTPKNPKKLLKTEQKTLKNIYTYRDYLSNLKILDPACGSGAFLNQALEFLISEHKYIDENRRVYENEGLSLYDMKSDILKNNLYGVDINEDAVEIAKLSLWIRTATRESELVQLADKIKCGNSLIDDKNVVDNAFVWEDEFKEVFEAGGFDVIIGNPPYGAKFNKEEKSLLKVKYENIYKGKFDSYHFFTYLGVVLLKEEGLLGYIIPDSWTSLQQTEKLRKFILSNYIISIQHHDFFIFNDAKIDSLNLILEKKSEINKTINIEFLKKDLSINYSIISQERLLNNEDLIINYLTTDIEVELLNKIKKDNSQIKDFCEWSQGLVPYSKREMLPIYGLEKTTEIMSNRSFHSDYKKDETFKKEIDGRDISKYELQWNGKSWISYGKWLVFPRPQKYFTSPRVLVQRIRGRMGTSIIATYTDEEYYNNPALSNFISLENSTIFLKFLLSILNSKMINWYFQNTFFDDMNIKPTDLEKLPIPNISKIEQQPLINDVNNIMESKQKIKDYRLLYDEAVTNNNFDREIKLKSEMEALEKIVIDSELEIDTMVYELYGLSEDEIKIIEGN